MNLLRICGATLFVALAVGMSACKNEEAPVTTPTTSELVDSGKKISLNVEIEGLPSEDLRMILQENKVAGKHAGLKFKWEVGDRETVYIAFKKEGSSSREVVSRQSSLIILGKSGNRYKACIDVNAPAGIDPETDNILIAGAIGVNALDENNGIAQVPGPRYFYDKGESYTPPMYFAPTRLRSKVEDGVKGYYADDLTFHFFGAMIGATIDNTAGNMPYFPHEFTFKTDVITTEGGLDLFNYKKNSKNQLVPEWKSLQNVTTPQRVYFDQGVVNKGDTHTFYFWAVPSEFTGRREMEIELRTDAYDEYLEETVADITTRWNVKQLGMGKVHRLSAKIPAPKGDLIISEVFIGGGTYGAATAWEFYNPTDEPINLADYYIERYDYNPKAKSPSEWYPATPTYRSKLLPTRDQLKAGPHSPNSLEKHDWAGVNVARGILPPRKSAVFYTASVTNKGMMDRFKQREGLIYLFNIASETFNDFREDRRFYAEAFFAPRFDVAGGKQYRSRHRIVRKVGSHTETVDAFFWYTNGIRAQYPTASYFRKPGRDIPRKEMQINHNSDWLMRHRYEAVDWGYRFSYYFDRERLNRNVDRGIAIHWIEDNSTNGVIPAGSTENGYIIERPIFAPNYAKDDLSFRELKAQAEFNKYTPPVWWTKERALAADR